MTNASMSTRTTIQHRFEVPSGSAFSDLDVAIHWARQKASDLGVNTNFDDWCTVTTEDDTLVLVITETKS